MWRVLLLPTTVDQAISPTRMHHQRLHTYEIAASSRSTTSLLTPCSQHNTWLQGNASNKVTTPQAPPLDTAFTKRQEFEVERDASPPAQTEVGHGFRQESQAPMLGTSLAHHHRAGASRCYMPHHQNLAKAPPAVQAEEHPKDPAHTNTTAAHQPDGESPHTASKTVTSRTSFQASGSQSSKSGRSKPEATSRSAAEAARLST